MKPEYSQQSFLASNPSEILQLTNVSKRLEPFFCPSEAIFPGPAGALPPAGAPGGRGSEATAGFFGPRFSGSWTEDKYYSVLGLGKKGERVSEPSTLEACSFFPASLDSLEKKMFGVLSDAYLRENSKKKKRVFSEPRKPFFTVESCSQFHNAKVVRLCACNDFIRCPICRKKRQKRNRNKVSNYFQAVEARRRKRKDLQFQTYKLITLTIGRNGRSIGEMLDRIQKSFKKLRNRKIWIKGVPNNYFVASYEFAEDADNVHVHIVALSKFIDAFDLSKAWREITGDSFIVDIRAVTSFDNVVLEVCKYIMKDNDPTTTEDLAQFRDANKHRRYLVMGRRPPELDTLATSEHPVCSCCSQKIGYHGDFKSELEATTWLQAQIKSREHPSPI
jgi:hypothetical protein